MRIVLEFDPGDPPSGRVVRDDQVDEFSGRLELYAALERARAAAAAASAESGSPRQAGPAGDHPSPDDGPPVR
jgi:hypothetical protein